MARTPPTPAQCGRTKLAEALDNVYSKPLNVSTNLQVCTPNGGLHVQCLYSFCFYAHIVQGEAFGRLQGMHPHFTKVAIVGLVAAAATVATVVGGLASFARRVRVADGWVGG